MTQGEVKAFWSGFAAANKGVIVAGSNKDLERVEEPEIDDILQLVIDWAEDKEF